MLCEWSAHYAWGTFLQGRSIISFETGQTMRPWPSGGPPIHEGFVSMVDLTPLLLALWVSTLHDGARHVAHVQSSQSRSRSPGWLSSVEVQSCNTMACNLPDVSRHPFCSDMFAIAQPSPPPAALESCTPYTRKLLLEHE